MQPHHFRQACPIPGRFVELPGGVGMTDSTWEADEVRDDQKCMQCSFSKSILKNRSF